MLNEKARIYVPLILLCGISLLLFLGDTPFNTRGEPREAVVAMSMINDGNWILPVNNGDEIAFKPPFLHWLVAAFSLVAGSVSEFTSRLPSALGCIAMVLCVYAYFERRRNSLTAMLTALVLLTCFEVHRAAMTCRVDMLLASATVIGLIAAARWTERGCRRLPFLATVCFAAAALTKGPVGAALPCGIVFLFLLLRGKCRWYTALWKMILVGILALIPLVAWYIAAYMQPHGGERFLQLIYEENVLRFLGKMSYASHVNPWPYNIMTVVTGFLPYTLAFVVALPLGIRWMRSAQWKAVREKLRWNAVRDWWNSLRDADAFAATCFVVTFVFYCIPASKRSVYLLPLYPFAAYFVASFLAWLTEKHRRTLRTFGCILSGLVIVLTLAFVAVRWNLVPETIFKGKHAAENVAFLEALRTVPLGVAGTLLAAFPCFLALAYVVRRRTTSALMVTAIVYALQLSLDGLYLPPIMEVKTDRGVAQRIEKIAPQGTIYSFRTDVLEANRLHPFTINFYLGDRIIPIDKAPAMPRDGFLIVGNDEIRDFTQAYPQYGVTEVFDAHHRSCDDKKMLHFYRFTIKR